MSFAVVRGFEEERRPFGKLREADFWRLEIGGEGILASGRGAWLRVISWMVLLFAFAALVLFASFQLGTWAALPERFDYAVGIGTPLAGLAVYALAVRIGEARSASELALRAAGQLLSGAAVGFAFMALSLAVLWALGLNKVAPGHWQHWFHYLVFNAYISAVVEELGFRAILLRLFARLFGPVPGLVISAVLFALAHASHAPPVSVALLIVDGGLLLGVLYMATGSLWAAIGAHVAYDFVEWSLFGVGDKDGVLVVSPMPGYPDWLTGGQGGPDGSVFSALIAAGLIWLVLRRESAGWKYSEG